MHSSVPYCTPWDVSLFWLEVGLIPGPEKCKQHPEFEKFPNAFNCKVAKYSSF